MDDIPAETTLPYVTPAWHYADIIKAMTQICCPRATTATRRLWGPDNHLHRRCHRTLRQSHKSPRIQTAPHKTRRTLSKPAKASHSTIRRYQQCRKPNNRPAHDRQWMHHSCLTSSLEPLQSLTDRSQTNRCDRCGKSTASHDLPMGHGRLDEDRRA